MSEGSVAIEDLLAGALSWDSKKEPQSFSCDIAQELSFYIAFFFSLILQAFVCSFN